MELAEEDDELKNIYAKIRELEFSIGTLGKILLTCQTQSTNFRWCPGAIWHRDDEEEDAAGEEENDGDGGGGGGASDGVSDPEDGPHVPGQLQPLGEVQGSLNRGGLY